MGWVSENRPKGFSNQDWFADKFDYPRSRVVDAATVNGVCYIALEEQYAGEEYVCCIVAMTRWSPHDYYNFSYKMIDETTGPADTLCPQRILDLLSPLEKTPWNETEQRLAGQWRQACQARLDSKKRRGSVSQGDRILLAEPLRFSDGQKAQAFEWIRGNTFFRLTRTASGYTPDGKVGIRDWREREWAKL